MMALKKTEFFANGGTTNIKQPTIENQIIITECKVSGKRSKDIYKSLITLDTFTSVGYGRTQKNATLEAYRRLLNKMWIKNEIKIEKSEAKLQRRIDGNSYIPPYKYKRRKTTATIERL